MSGIVIADASVPFFESPLFVTVAGIVCATLITIAGAAIKMVVQISGMQHDIKAIATQVAEIKGDPDVMRWSNYGRATQSFGVAQQTPGMQP